jgi:hypothetical protein
LSKKYVLVLTIITNCPENNQVSHVSFLDTSKKAWEELGKLFEAHDATTKIYLSDKLDTMKMRKNKSTRKYIHAF